MQGGRWKVEGDGEKVQSYAEQEGSRARINRGELMIGSIRYIDARTPTLHHHTSTYGRPAQDDMSGDFSSFSSVATYSVHPCLTTSTASVCHLPTRRRSTISSHLAFFSSIPFQHQTTLPAPQHSQRQHTPTASNTSAFHSHYHHTTKQLYQRHHANPARHCRRCGPHPR